MADRDVNINVRLHGMEDAKEELNSFVSNEREVEIKIVNLTEKVTELSDALSKMRTNASHINTDINAVSQEVLGPSEQPTGRPRTGSSPSSRGGAGTHKTSAAERRKLQELEAAEEARAERLKQLKKLQELNDKTQADIKQQQVSYDPLTGSIVPVIPTEEPEPAPAPSKKASSKKTQKKKAPAPEPVVEEPVVEQVVEPTVSKPARKPRKKKSTLPPLVEPPAPSEDTSIKNKSFADITAAYAQRAAEEAARKGRKPKKDPPMDVSALKYPDAIKVSRMPAGWGESYIRSIKDTETPVTDINEKGIAQAEVALERGGDPGVTTLAAKLGKEVVGALSFSIEKNPIYKQLTISDLGAKYKHGGIGTRLLQEAERIARSLAVDVIKISNALPDAHDTYVNNLYEMRDKSDMNMHTTDMYKRISGLLPLDILEKSKSSHAELFDKRRQSALLNAAFNTRKTGNETPIWLDMLGRNLPIDFTASSKHIKFNKESSATQQSYQKAYELWHTHPGENYPIMSPADIKSAIAGKVPAGVLASDTLRGIKIDPTGIDMQGGELLANYWEHIVDSIYETNGDEIVDYAIANSKGSTKDFTDYLHPYVNELLYKKFKEMLTSVNVAFEEVDYSKFLNMPMEATKKKEDPVQKVFESFMRNKSISAKDIITVGSQHGLKLTSASAKALLQTFRDTVKKESEQEEAKEASSVDIAKEESKKPMRKRVSKKRPSTVTTDEAHDILFRLPDITTSTQNTQGVADLITNLKKILGDAWTITAHKPQLVQQGVQSQAIDAKITASLGIVDKLRETLIGAFTKAIESSTIPLPTGEVMGIKTRIGPAKKPPLGPQQDAHVHEYAAVLAEAKATETQLAEDEKARVKSLSEKFTADMNNRKGIAKEQAALHREQSSMLAEGRRLTASHIIKYQDSIRKELRAEYMAKPGARLESPKSIATEDADEEKQAQDALIERLQAEVLNLKFLDKEQKEAMKNTDAFGRTINRLVEKGGILGRLSWSFTSLAMSSLGVYFSLMSIVNMLQQGIMAVFNPLQNLQGLIQGFALGQSLYKGTSADLNEYYKRLFGDDKGLQHIIDAWLYLQKVMGTFNATLGGFGAKVLLDPEVQASIERIIAAVQDFLDDESTFTMVKDLIKGLADHMPEIVEGFRDLGRLVQMVIIPNIGLFVKAWSLSMILMPVMSLASALFNVLKIVFSLISAVNMFRTAMIAAMGTDTYVAAMKKAFFHPMVAMAGTHGALAGTAYASGFIAGIAGIYALDQLGVLKGARQLGANTGNWIQGKPQTVLQEDKHEWWDLVGAISGTPYDKIIPRADGGPLRAGQVAVVGERGPELLIPKGDVDIVPNHQLRFLANGTTTIGSGETYTVTIYNTDPNMSSSKIAAALEKAGIPKTVKVTIKDALRDFANEISYYDMPSGVRMPYGKDIHSVVLTNQSSMPGMTHGGFAFEPRSPSTVPAPWHERGVAISDTVQNDKDLGNRLLHEAAHTYGLKADDMLKSGIFNDAYGKVQPQPTPIDKDDIDAHSAYLKYIYGDEDFTTVHKESVKETKNLTDTVIKLTKTLWDFQTNPKFRLGGTPQNDVVVVNELQAINTTMQKSEGFQIANMSNLTSILNKKHGGSVDADAASVFGNRLVPGTNVLQAQGVSLAGGPGDSESLKNVGSWTMTQGGKTWNMNTSVGLGESMSFTAPKIKKQSETDFGKIGADIPEPNLGILPFLILGSTIASIGGALASKGGALSGMLSGGASKLTGMFGKGASTAAEPLTMEVGQLISKAQMQGTKALPMAKTFEIGDDLVRAAVPASRGAGVMGGIGTMARFAGPVGYTLAMMEMLRMGAPATGFSNEQLTAGESPEFKDYMSSFGTIAKNPLPTVDPRKQTLAEKSNTWEKLAQGQIKTNELLDAFKKEQHEDNKVSTNYLAGINANIQSQTKPGEAYSGGGSGAGVAGSGGVWGGAGSAGGPGKPTGGKPTGTAADFLPSGPTGGILTASPYHPGGVIEEANPYHKPTWSKGPKDNQWADPSILTGDVAQDFGAGGPGWNLPYGAGDSYGWDNSSGAPSVSGYAGGDPYKTSDTGNGKWVERESGHYFTDLSGKTWGPFKNQADGEKYIKSHGGNTSTSATKSQGDKSGTGWRFTTPFTKTETYSEGSSSNTSSNVKIKTVSDLDKGWLTVGGESTLIDKRNFNFAELEAAMQISDASKQHAAKWQTATAADFGYQNLGASASSGMVGEVVQQGKDTFIRQADGSLKLISSMASGGLLTKGGLINAHAGEVIGPLGQVASTLAQAATVNSTNNSATNQNITVNITITGDATKDVTDDMIRKIKRDLFGRGVV